MLPAYLKKDFDKNPARNDYSEVGNGYRNVCYRFSRDGGQIILFGYDAATGEPRTFTFPYYPHVSYESHSHSTIKDLYGKYVQQKWFKDTQERKFFVDNLDESVKIVECYPPEQEFLLEVFGKKAFDDDFNKQPLRVHYLDIEIAIENEFPEAAEAKYPVNVITIFDSKTERYHSWALSMNVTNESLTKNGYPVDLNSYASEHDLLTDFLSWWHINTPDVVTGWNVRFFDMLYLYNRLSNVFGTKIADSISPIGRCKIREDIKRYSNKYVEVRGLATLDLLLLYRDKFQIHPTLDGGYNLSNVAQTEVEDDKKEYEGSMRDFYKNDFQSFWEYNVQDVALVVKLEKKLNLISLTRKITSMGCNPYEKIYTSISYIIENLDIFSRNKFGKMFLSFKRREAEMSSEQGELAVVNTENDMVHSPETVKKASKTARTKGFRGAYVFDTVAGLYRQGEMTVDVNSLYPNTARALNLSPETMVGEICDRPDGLYEFVPANGGQTKVITKDTLDRILAEKCTISKRNILFWKYELQKGIFAEWCGYFFDKRKEYKKALAKAEDAAEAEKDPVKKGMFEAEAERLHTAQYAMKIMINSAYGTLGTKFSPIFDTRLAESITLTGQFCNKSTAKFLKNVFTNELNCPEDFNVTISGDTDSVAGDSMIEWQLCSD
jgi:DNA polymerase elongation subunit (family B)